MKRISTTPDTPEKTILVGTYRKDQLEKWVLPQVRSICAIHGERNIAVHEARQTYSDPWTFLVPDGSFDLGDIYLPMGDIDLWGDWDCRDWPTFCGDAMAPLESFGSKFNIKDDLRRAMRRSCAITMPKLGICYNENFHDRFFIISGKKLQ